MTLTPARLRELIRFAEKRAESSLTYATEKTCRDTAAALTDYLALRERVEGVLEKWGARQFKGRQIQHDTRQTCINELRAAIATEK